MELSQKDTKGLLEILATKPHGELELRINSLKSASTSEAHKQEVLNEIGVKVGVDTANLIGKFVLPKIDVGVDYTKDWKDHNETFSAEWIASEAVLKIKWSGGLDQGKVLTALHLAVEQQDVGLVESLLQSDEWVETLRGSNSPLAWARLKKDTEIASLLQSYLNEHSKKAEESATSTDKKLQIDFCTMPEAMKGHAIGCAMQALEKFDDVQKVAEHIRSEFVTVYGSQSWQCIVSKHNFGWQTWHAERPCIRFRIGEVEVALFQSTTGVETNYKKLEIIRDEVSLAIRKAEELEKKYGVSSCGDVGGPYAGLRSVCISEDSISFKIDHEFIVLFRSSTDAEGSGTTKDKELEIIKHAIGYAVLALEKNKNDHDIARYIENGMKAEYGKHSWTCSVSKYTGIGPVVRKSNYHVFFRMSQHLVDLVRSID